MLRIAMFALSSDTVKTLKGHVERYREEKGLDVECQAFESSERFLNNQHEFDLAIVDAEASNADDGRLVTELRRLNRKIALIFVTSHKQFTIKNYEDVDALFFLGAPISYPAFATLLDRVQVRLVSQDVPTVAVMTKEGARRVAVDQITYLDATPHHVIYHLVDGETLRVRGTLNEESKKVTADRFFRLGNYLVNLGHVYKVWEDDLYVGDACLLLPRNKKQALLSSLLAYMNRG